MFKIRYQTREIELTSLIVCIISGLLLLSYFDVLRPLQSVSHFTLLKPFANILRNVHFWSTLILLFSVIIEIIKSFKAKLKVIINNGFFGAIIVLTIILFILLTGMLLRGDILSQQIHQTASKYLNYIPAIGSWLSDFFTGKDNKLGPAFILHISFAGAIVFLKATEYFRKQKINFAIVLIIVFSILMAGIFFNINLIDTSFHTVGININSFSIPDSLTSINKPVILGRNEGCVYCHNNVQGLTTSHNPDSIGCSSCHLGYPFSLDKQTAHSGMILIPGNLSGINNTCGSSNCHPDIASRINGSLMNSMSGVVTVDKYMFGELSTLSTTSDIKTINHSPSENHLRNLCASCHLNKEKVELGEVNESSRGGGCLACHLNYSNESKKEITVNKGELHKFHPSIDLKVTNDHCFGCHSRSGRISTNYEGWFETQLKPENVKGTDSFRELSDKRVFEKHEADIHSEKGMQCIDCHLSYELMGDGGKYLHKEDAVKIQCIDCHSNTFNNTISGNESDFEAKKILKIKGLPSDGSKYLKTTKGGYTITNTFFENLINDPVLLTKTGNKVLPLKKPIDQCLGGNAHERLSCSSCHTSMVSQCIGCHTEYKSENSSYDLLDDKDVKGEWIESNANIFNEQPTLGIRTVSNADGTIKTEVITFTPGMVLTIDNGNNSKIFKRLFAPVEAHNIRREVRSCKSCHNNPVALGYGRGNLVFNKNGQTGNWAFTPSLSIEQVDGLPMDGWIAFLTNPAKDNSTRENTRPFNLEEQKKILLVGACLTCHEENSKVMRESLIDFEKVIRKMKNKCSKAF